MKQGIPLPMALEKIEFLNEGMMLIEKIQKSTSMNEATKNANIFKNNIRKQKRNLAKKYHPDINGGDGERIKEINHICDLLLNLQVIPPRQQQVVIIRHEYRYSTTTNDYWTWSSTS